MVKKIVLCIVILTMDQHSEVKIFMIFILLMNQLLLYIFLNNVYHCPSENLSHTFLFVITWPSLIPFFKSPGTLFPGGRRRRGEGEGRGGGRVEAVFFLHSLKYKQSEWCSQNMQSNIAGHSQWIAPLHNHKRFAPSLHVFKKNMAVTALNCETPSSWFVWGPEDLRHWEWQYKEM